MAGWSRLDGLAVALAQDNIDTDQLIPARFMSVPRKDGYGDYLLHDQRFDADGTPRADMPLNRHPKAEILVTRRNFGTGSSREAAVYALVDFGIRAVLAPSFGDIFASNAVNNGLLPARVPEQIIDALISRIGADTATLSIDLENCDIRTPDSRISFELDPVWRLKLMNGWDDIDLTSRHRDAIAAFRARREEKTPYVMLRDDHA
ncbi:3-isopropylmalate dehydratase small subunit [Oceanibacterium hippocampi]|uniref:3-isopropylmalate dehydratase n=1 Tax=Oceanibacterium hippocampi TaxID=745714 RepID=A0A1Y5TT78_9PROT|nr:3-isopropylmalate dehydratase small subunit [Oceanibacterium hippocampi]SLN71455.1 3-isopropylmalate dehydratase small subunit [Oceanibacterium hippocampi]